MGICRWLPLFQEYDFEIIINPRRLNVGPSHLSRLERGEEPSNLDDDLPDAQLFLVIIVDEYFEEITHFFNTTMAPEWYTIVHKKLLVVKVMDYQLIAGQLYKLGPNGFCVNVFWNMRVL